MIIWRLFKNYKCLFKILIIIKKQLLHKKFQTKVDFTLFVAKSPSTAFVRSVPLKVELNTALYKISYIKTKRLRSSTSQHIFRREFSVQIKFKLTLWLSGEDQLIYVSYFYVITRFWAIDEESKGTFKMWATKII